MINRVQTKDNIGIVAVLDIKEPTHGVKHNKMVILNTHINWDPEYCDVKLIQNIMFMSEVSYLKYNLTNFAPNLAPKPKLYLMSSCIVNLILFVIMMFPGGQVYKRY